MPYFLEQLDSRSDKMDVIFADAQKAIRKGFHYMLTVLGDKDILGAIHHLRKLMVKFLKSLYLQ